MTSYGVRVLQELLPPAIAHGFGIISGLALGIDGTAHRITLDHHGYTLGILGTGIENASIYPRSHLSLATRILAEGGGLLSEFPPGTEGLPHHFPLRNRLIAAAGMATVVIEADVDSGSLITARAALDLGKDVFAVPGSIFSSASQGTHALLSQGAHPCVSVAALIDAIALDRPVLADAVAMTLPDDPFARAILETLTEPLTTDTLAERLDRPVPDVLAALALLELDSRVASPDRLTWIRLR